MKRLMRKTNEYLQKESLFGYLMHNTLKNIIFIFVSIFVFLFLFKPNALAECELKPLLILITGYSTIGSVSFALSYAVLSPHNRPVWTKQLEIGLFALCYFIAWLLIWGYTVLNVELLFKYVYDVYIIPPLPDNLMWVLFSYTIIIGGILYLVLHSYDILITYKKLGKQQELIESMKVGKDRLGSIKSQIIKLEGKNDNNVIELESYQFIAAKVEENYIKIYYKSCEGSIKHYMIRNSMLNIEHQLVNIEKAYRCHKSFIVNLDYLKTVYTITSKNKSFLTLDYYPEPIPVSPKKIGFLREKIEETKIGTIKET